MNLHVPERDILNIAVFDIRHLAKLSVKANLIKVHFDIVKNDLSSKNPFVILD